jgi:hypothetical protein
MDHIEFQSRMGLQEFWQEGRQGVEPDSLRTAQQIPACNFGNFNLRDNWYGSKLRKVEGRQQRLRKEPALNTVEPTDFLQAISLLRTYEKRQQDIAEGKKGNAVAAVSAKRASVLALSLDDFHKWADKVEVGFLLAAKFLRKQCFFSSLDLRYRSQLA